MISSIQKWHDLLYFSEVTDFSDHPPLSALVFYFAVGASRIRLEPFFTAALVKHVP